LLAGRSKETATVIAKSNQAVDIRAPASLWNCIFHAALFNLHFMARQKALGGVMSAETPAETGSALHSFQDSYFHAGKGWPLGHLLQGHAPDNTANNPDLALAAAGDSFVAMGGDASEFPVSFMESVITEKDADVRSKMLQDAASKIEEPVCREPEGPKQ
jgi:hypothetical protein